jgi:hypothetical protein
MMAMAGSAIGACLFIWAVGALLGGNDVPPERGTADGVTLATTRPASSSNPPPTGRLLSGPGSSSSAAPSLSAQATTPPAVPTTTTAPTTTSPAPPQVCPDSAMRVTVTTTQPIYQVGDHIPMTLHIANAGPVPCIRDVSRQFRSILLRTADGATLWSSSYCYTVSTHEIRLLQPNQSLSYGIVWPGRTAAPGCPVHRTAVGAGQYALVGLLGDITGPPTPVTIDA